MKISLSELQSLYEKVLDEDQENDNLPVQIKKTIDKNYDNELDNLFDDLISNKNGMNNIKRDPILNFQVEALLRREIRKIIKESIDLDEAPTAVQKVRSRSDGRAYKDSDVNKSKHQPHFPTSDDMPINQDNHQTDSHQNKSLTAIQRAKSRNDGNAYKRGNFNKSKHEPHFLGSNDMPVNSLSEDDETDTENWKHTDTISFRNQAIPVMKNGGLLYTEEEWEAKAQNNLPDGPDWSMGKNGEILDQGEPVQGAKLTPYDTGDKHHEATLEDMATATGLSIQGASNLVNSAIEKFKFLWKLPEEDRNFIVMSAARDYISYLSKAKDLKTGDPSVDEEEISEEDIQLLKDHPEMIIGMDEFRNFLHKHIKPGGQGRQKVNFFGGSDD